MVRQAHHERDRATTSGLGPATPSKLHGLGWAPPGSMIPRDPSSCRGWMRLSCRPAFQQTVRTARATTTIERDVAKRSLPVPCTLQRCPILRGSDGSRPRRVACPPLRYYRTQGRMGARVMASGMPGASRRAVLGGATYSVVKVWVRLSGAGRPAAASQSAPHPWRASSPRHVRSAWSWITCWTWLKLALRVEYSTWVRSYRHGWTGWAGLRGVLGLTGDGTHVLALGVGWGPGGGLVPWVVEGCE